MIELKGYRAFEDSRDVYASIDKGKGEEFHDDVSLEWLAEILDEDDRIQLLEMAKTIRLLRG